MAMIKRADAQTIARDAMVLDLGDLARQAETIMRQAHARANAIMAEAQQERERIVAGAKQIGHAEGRAAGHAEGLVAGREEGRKAAVAECTKKIESLAATWNDGLSKFNSQREELANQCRQDVLNLALEIAQRVTRRAIEVDAKSVETALETAVSLVMRPTRAKIRVNPIDEQVSRDLMPRLLATFDRVKHVEITGDESIERGGCILQAEGGASIDATVSTQLDRIVEALLPRSEAV